VQRLVTPEGPLAITCTYEYRPLGFSLELLKFQRGLNPGGMGEASFTSIVRLIDKNQGLDQERQIAMNQPLAHGKLSFYQSSFDESPGSTTTSTLTVAYDPGRFLKYLGCLMVCGGTVVLFWRKMRLFAGER
jgi:cytochrome c biogenesis protein ResB